MSVQDVDPLSREDRYPNPQEQIISRVPCVPYAPSAIHTGNAFNMREYCSYDLFPFWAMLEAIARETQARDTKNSTGANPLQARPSTAHPPSAKPLIDKGYFSSTCEQLDVLGFHELALFFSLPAHSLMGVRV